MRRHRRVTAGRAITVIGVDLDARKLGLAESFGATRAADASRNDQFETIRALTGGNGADVCIEAVGNWSATRR